MISPVREWGGGLISINSLQSIDYRGSCLNKKKLVLGLLKLILFIEVLFTLDYVV